MDKGAESDPGRRRLLGSFGALAASAARLRPDIDASLKELEYALDTLGADGVGVYSNTGDHWLGNPLFEPLHAELNRRHAVVYVHSVSPFCCRGLVGSLPDMHGGGAMPFLLERFFGGTEVQIVRSGVETTRALGSGGVFDRIELAAMRRDCCRVSDRVEH